MNNNINKPITSLLVIIGGGIAAYKSIELIRLLRTEGIKVSTILTEGGSKFITPLTISSVSDEFVHEDMFSFGTNGAMHHITLSRECDGILVCPASADLLSKMAYGRADDLASACLLASDKPIFVAPAMNVRMWEAEATRCSVELLKSRDVSFIGPVEGAMACGEYGYGRLSDIDDIFGVMMQFLGSLGSNLGEGLDLPLRGKRVLVTAGPTYEPLDSVRFIGNYSSGKQGYGFARAFRDLGADVTLVSGVCVLPDISGVRMVKVSTAGEMLEACELSLPCDIAVCAAAVSDWRVSEVIEGKLKKGVVDLSSLSFVETVDILRHLSTHSEHRPSVVVGFAAESVADSDNGEGGGSSLLALTRDKLVSKGCDIVLGNLVSGIGVEENSLLWVDVGGVERHYDIMGKLALSRLVVSDLVIYMRSVGLL